MFDDLVHKYKKEKGIDSVEQAKQAVRGERHPAMQITPGPAVGWAPNSNEDDRTGVEMPDERHWNARWPPKEEKESPSKASRQLLTDTKKS
jgi:hypothetical protein